jgi:hypothetical protein
METTIYTTRVRYRRTQDGVQVSTREDGSLEARRVPGSPRETMVTISDGRAVWFGIARWDGKPTPPLSKKWGRQIAEGRTQKARVAYQGFGASSPLTISDDGLSGTCGMDQIDELMEYFYTGEFKRIHQRWTAKQREQTEGRQVLTPNGDHFTVLPGSAGNGKESPSPIPHN